MVFGLLAMTVLSSRPPRAGRQATFRGPVVPEVMAEEVTWMQGADFPSHAPPMDVDMEYQVDGGWGANYDHIPDPEMCAALCQGVARCQAYTWIKDAGLDGCPSQCWLKDSVGKKVPKKGLVSGVPPPRKELPVAFLGGGAVSAGGSLYCFALMVPGGYEEGLLRWQHEQKAGIFGCNEAAIYSNDSVAVADNVRAKVVNSTLKCEYGGDSMSALNSWIFIAVWEKVIALGDFKAHEWVVKVDPDAVFFPARLGRLLTEHAGAGYINNCKYGMHGPIEVFSSHAISLLGEDYRRSWDGKAPSKCVSKLNFGLWGEDMFIDQCLGKVLDVGPRPTEPRLMCESHCDCPAWYWCGEGPDVVSYHPFKSIDSWKACMGNALAQDSMNETEVVSVLK